MEVYRNCKYIINTVKIYFMNTAVKIILFYCILVTGISVAQTSMDSLILNSKKINFENLKRISNEIYNNAYDCDSLSTGTTVELRYCLNIWLQREDSLLKKKLNEIIESKNDTLYDDALFIKKIKLTQEIWEQYRFAYCNQCIGNYRDYEKADIFSFLNCAIELTIKRRKDIEKICDY
jgi:hypothetical protein